MLVLALCAEKFASHYFFAVVYFPTITRQKQQQHSVSREQLLSLPLLAAAN